MGYRNDPAHVVQGIPSACDVRGKWDVRMHDLHAEVADSMGLMRSRAELVAERRTMQFVVERRCSQRHPDEGDFDAPILIEVYWPAEAQYDPEWDPCGRPLFRATPYGIELAKRFDPTVGTTGRECVCEHMGHIIE